MQKYKEQNILFRKFNKGQVVEEHILVKSLIDKQLYILKKTDISKMTNDKANQFEKHLQNLIAIKHPSLIQIKDFFKDGKFIVQVLEYCGQQTLHERLSRKISVNLVTQYLLQLLFALHYLELQNIHVTLDMETIFLNSFGSLRIQFDLLSNKNWKDEVKHLQNVIKKANVDWESQTSHELHEILRQLLQPDPPSVQQLINHPYLLKAMFDFCKQQEHEAQARQNQEKLIQQQIKQQRRSSAQQKRTKIKSASPSCRQKQQSNPQTHKHQPKNHPHNPCPLPRERQKSIELPNNQQAQNINSINPLEQTKGQNELEELLQIYRNQLVESTKQGYNPWLNLSEIKEVTEYDSTANSQPK